MTEWRADKVAVVILLLLGLLMAVPVNKAERLPLRPYTTAEGLTQNNVKRIIRDSRGFLWFCTADGLSRFDGYNFTNYGMEHGLPHPSVNDLLEERPGVYWIATNGGGVCRFFAGRLESTTRSRSTVYQVGDTMGANWVNVLCRDRAGRLWAGTDDGLFYLDEAEGQRTFHRFSLNQRGPVAALMEDRQGALWIGADGLYRRWPDGRLEHYTEKHGVPSIAVKALLEDNEGRLWVGTYPGLCLLVSAPEPGRPVVARLYTMKDGLPGDTVNAVFQTSDGMLWAGLETGLGQLTPGERETGQAFRSYGTAHGLRDTKIRALGEDRDDNLWLGTVDEGVFKLTHNGFVSYAEADGLGHPWIASIFEARAGELCVISGHGGAFINRFDGQRFTAIRPNLPRQIAYLGWGMSQLALQDHVGEWWVPTGEGLCRFPAVSRVEQLAQVRPKSVYTTKDGLKGNSIFRLYEDSRGDIWIGNINSPDYQDGLTRWERATGIFHRYGETDGLLRNWAPTAFREDRAGSLWVGFYGGGLARYREGRFTMLATADGVPAGQIRGLYLDHAGRLWVATNQGGVGRLDDPSADRPRFVTYTIAQGLTSNNAWCITEDKWGRVYIGTGRGVDMLDPTTGRIKHYTVADGLIGSTVGVAFSDRQGRLWFGTDKGLSRLVPHLDTPQHPPPILITALRIAGGGVPLSELGETEVAGLELRPNQNQIQIEFVGLSFAAGERLRYRYKLEGVDRDWSAPTDQRAVNYASLSPGTYRFLVEAVSADEVVSATPAMVLFRILPPVWQRWWFLTLAAALVGLLVYAAHRYRVRRLVELERIRTRIATDLHDDIGSNLSQIAILSEVARNQASRGDRSSEKQLSIVARIARESVDAMGDIVWAINPQRDWLSDLVGRMRRFTSEILPARGIEFQFSADIPERDIKLGADVRRQIFLIFKECVNNIARHSACVQANITLWVEASWFVMKLSDNGKGFDVAAVDRGQGLASMQRRAESLGGTLQINTQNGTGTSVTLRAPFSRRALRWKADGAKRKS